MFSSILLVFILTVFIYIWTKLPRNLNLPRPPALPILGNLFQIDLKRPHIQLTEWAEKYGEVFYISLMRANWVVISSYEHLQKVLFDKGYEFANRPDTFRLAYLTFGWKSLVWADGRTQFHTVAKKTALYSLKLHGGGKDKIDDVVSTIMVEFNKKIEQTKGRPHNPKVDIYNFALQGVLHFLIGRFLDDGSDLIGMARELTQLGVSSVNMAGKGSELDAFPWLRFFPNKTFKNMKSAKNMYAAFWERVKPDILEDSVMASLIMTQQGELKKTGKQTIDEDNLMRLMVDILIAGTSTTSNSLATFINLMIHYPNVQERIQLEVDTKVGTSRHVTLMDRQNMPYTRAVIYELNRYLTVTPLCLPHAAITNCSLAGATIPKGTRIIPNLWALHHDEKFWGDPWKFRPERFLDEQGDLVLADHENRKHLMAFGVGPRVCVGELFALSRMFLFISSLLQVYNIKAAPGQKVSCDARSYYVSGAVLSVQDYEACFTARD